jgi:hypothetical protein
VWALKVRYELVPIYVCYLKINKIEGVIRMKEPIDEPNFGSRLNGTCLEKSNLWFFDKKIITKFN